MQEASPMMAKWASNNQKLNCRGLNEDDMVMGHLLSHKSGMELMQNCDLPPPLKVFTGSDKRVISSMNRVCGLMGVDAEEGDTWEFEDQNETKLDLLKALRLSQTRAREAEKRAASLAKERDYLSKAFLDDSFRLLAYRQCVKLLEAQVSVLQSRRQRQDLEYICSDCEDDNGVGLSLFVALALCLGIAGVGFAFGCRYLF